mmetsp:Transcript_151029/g.262418  ORF Transcript_151029/g.262418 Transcript_151029/m.262418 type:complete len:101 (-) Transcript_151029:58-360(-)
MSSTSDILVSHEFSAEESLPIMMATLFRTSWERTLLFKLEAMLFPGRIIPLEDISMLSDALPEGGGVVSTSESDPLLSDIEVTSTSSDAGSTLFTDGNFV